MFLKKIILYIFILGFFTLNFAQSINVKVSTDSSDYNIGDFINVKYNLNYDKSLLVGVPDIKDKLNKLELLNFKDTVLSSEKEISRQLLFTLTCYNTGQVTIPQLEFIYQKTNDTIANSVFSDSIVVKINAIEVDTTNDIKDIKPPFVIKMSKYIYLLLAGDILFPNFINYLITLAVIFPDYAEWILYSYLGILILFMLFYLWKRKYGEKQTVIQTDKRPIHEIAMEELEKLDSKKLWQSGKIKEYHSEITHIIRNYLERRFGFPALENTSFEIMEKIKDITEAKDVISQLETFLSNADLVKFAKFTPMNFINEAMLNQAKEIVNKTIKEENLISENQKENV